MKTILTASVLFSVLLSLAPAALAQGSGEPRTGTLKTNVSPGRAGVFIDGKYMGSAANFKRGHKFALNAGEHEVTLVDPRYEEFKTTVMIPAGGSVTLSQRLKELPKPQPPFGRLKTVDFDKYSAVYLNGKFYGHADEIDNFAQGLLIRPGEYTVRVTSVEGATLHEETVKVVEDKTTIVRGK